ncbi:MAG: hypothetical protein AB2535_20950 [Candidatus Thiodiazotropha endolucinida]
MTTQTQDQNLTKTDEKANPRPSHIVRQKIENGKHAEFETIGAAWDRGNGSLYIKVYGTQVIKGGFYVFPVVTDQERGQ